MRQLDSCDFCGRPAEGVFEVVPASIAGESRRLALCADCRATLQSVVDPLLDAAESGRSAGDEPRGGESAGGGSMGRGSTDTRPTGSESSAGSSVDNSETDVASHELDATPADEPAADTDDESPDSAAAESGRDRADQSSGRSNYESAAPDDGVTIGAEGSEQGSEGSEQGSEETEQGGDASHSNSQREWKPEGYAQVVRLLQNRDGGMPREDLRTLATNAYDLGDRQFDDAVDAAIENGDVQETGDGLQTE